MRPILLNSCAMAATRAEARFRIDAFIAPSRATRVMALDAGAEWVIRWLAGQTWANARFFTCAAGRSRVNGSGAAMTLRAVDGTADALLGAELTGADVAVMVAASDDGAAAASSIGAICGRRGIMTAGLVLGDGGSAGAAAAALRPHARVLMTSADEHDVAELLTALRA